MTATDDLSPIEITQWVAAPVEHAFTTFVERIAMWWPRDHLSEPGSVAVLEPTVGGRIYERTMAGDEIDWGVVTAFDPPASLAFSWHIGATPAEATDVTVHFEPDGDATALRLVHGGWDRLGETAAPRRARNRTGWADVLTPYIAAAALA